MKHIKVCIKCFMTRKDCQCEDREMVDFCDTCNFFTEDCKCKENIKNKDVEGQVIF